MGGPASTPVKPVQAPAPIAAPPTQPLQWNWTSNFSATPQSGNAPLTVNFRDTSSGSYTGGTTEQRGLANLTSLGAVSTSNTWNFGDGQTTTGVWTPSHTYKFPGSYTVTFTSTGKIGSSSSTGTASKTITVTGHGPQEAVTPPQGVAQLQSTAAAQSRTTPQPTLGINQIVPTFDVLQATNGNPAVFVFKDTSINGPQYWSWDFGDGIGTADSPNPSYTYQWPGTYQVMMYVSNDAMRQQQGPDSWLSASASLNVKTANNTIQEGFGQVTNWTFIIILLILLVFVIYCSV